MDKATDSFVLNKLHVILLSYLGGSTQSTEENISVNDLFVISSEYAQAMSFLRKVEETFSIHIDQHEIDTLFFTDKHRMMDTISKYLQINKTNI